MENVHFRQAENNLEVELLRITERRFQVLKEAGEAIEADPLSLKGRAALRVASDARRDQTRLCKRLIALRKVMGKQEC